MSTIEVTYDAHATGWHINQVLAGLTHIEAMSFDIETKGVYSKIQRKEAMKLLESDLDTYTHKLVSVVANNSGLSFPSLITVTHFVFGLNDH